MRANEENINHIKINTIIKINEEPEFFKNYFESKPLSENY